MSNSITAYPLQWPAGWKRAIHRRTSKFKPGSFGRVRDELFSELRRMGAQQIVLSTNIPLKLDGMPYAKFASIADVGVAVYFTYKKKQMVFACDTWRTIEENTTSITRTIEALRGIERWGASEMLERAFTGFAQLEAPQKEEWWDVLQCNRHSSVEIIKMQYRRLARDHHPDGGGSDQMMAKINHAYDLALKEKGG